MNIMGFFRALFGKGKNRFSGIKQVVLCVGNTGEKYVRTRHNFGFMVADAFTGSLKQSCRFSAAESDVVVGEYPGFGCVAVVKPRTFVNRSGNALAAVLEKSGLSTGSFLVVVDDLNLALGTMRFRANGSDGGHNGLKSIISVVGREFPRLRLGVGPVPSGTSTIDFVLGEFPGPEMDTANRVAGDAAAAIGLYLVRGIGPAMNEYNKYQARESA
jgi:peptidyl-tRNA hydrolase, PTH1 family